MTNRPSSDNGRIGAIVSAAALAVVVVVALTIDAATDRLVIATVLAYAPRWLWLAVPIAAVPFVVAACRRSRLRVVLAFGVVIGPIMQPSLPVARALVVHGAGKALSVLTCNVASGAIDRRALRALVRTESPDIVLLQECTPDEGRAILDGLPLHVVARGGLCTATPHAILAEGAVRERTPPDGWGAYVMETVIEANGAPVHAFNVHLETPRKGIEPLLFDRDADGLALLRANTQRRALESRVAAEAIARTDGRMVAAGDFNMPTDSALYRSNWSRFGNAFSIAGSGFGYTKRTRWLALRVDHVLVGTGWRVLSAEVEPSVGSDHRPLIATLLESDPE